MAGALTAAIAAAFSGVTPDPYFEYTTLLLPGNGPNLKNNNEFLDSSANAFTITRNPLTGPNAPTQGTFSPFSQTGWGNYFNGSSGNLEAPYNAAFDYGSGNFTIEFWIYPTGATDKAILLQSNNTSTFGPIWIRYGPSGTINIYATTANGSWNLFNNTAVTGTISLNTWTHIAITRTSTGVWTSYVNGSSAWTATATGSLYVNSNKVNIGTTTGDTTYVFAGYLSNLRIVKGVVVYTGNFTPPTSPLAATQSAGTNISAITTGQTSLLTCQSNRFIDNGQGNTSNTSFTITVNGSPSVVAFSPFNPTSSWSATTNGGSGYFDGSGDYLTTPNTAAFQLGTGDFEISGWFYVSSLAATNILDTRSSNGLTPYSVGFSSLGYPNMFDGTIDPTGSSGIKAGQWNYVVWTRVSGTLRMFVNGTSVYSASNSSNFTGAGSNLTIGSIVGGIAQPLNGYMSDLRIVKGSGITTSTVPTEPLTAITNTSLLLNFTNAGIYDATSKNDLETVGNAQISTAQFQFAPSSMAFDGNGDYLIMPDAQTGQFLTGDFTVEYWCRFGSQGTNYAPQVGTLTSASLSGTWRFGTFTNNGGVYLAYHNGSAFVDVQFGSTAYNDNTWRHFALTRSGTTVRAFVNGTQVGTNQTVSQNFNSSNKVSVGAELLSPSYFNGYIQDLRITKGYARYTANFTAPTAAFPTL